MFEPVGPLPAAVYRRRRFVALASAVLVVGLVLATAGVHTATPVPAADRVPVPETSTPTPAPTLAPIPAPTAAPPGPIAPSSALAGTPTTAPAAPDVAVAVAEGGSDTASTDTASVDTDRIRPDDTPRAAEPTVAVPPTGPVPCTNAMLAAAAVLDHAVHRVGSHPVLRLVITNVGNQPCVRDLDSARQEIVVWSADGRDRLWSSNDCANASTDDLRTLLPGRPVAFAVTWGERTTTPGCRQPRTLVPAGTYRLMVRLDDLISPPTPFIRTP